MDISLWYCCIHAREKAVLDGTASYFILNALSYMPLDAWVVLCNASGLTAAAMQAAFLSIYGLETVAVTIDPELPPVDVVTPRLPALWSAWLAFLLSPAATCVGGCQLSRPPYKTVT